MNSFERNEELVLKFYCFQQFFLDFLTFAFIKSLMTSHITDDASILFSFNLI